MTTANIIFSTLNSAYEFTYIFRIKESPTKRKRKVELNSY
jgi:hypothetical protein